MRNTATTAGKNDTRTLLKAAQSPPAQHLFSVLAIRDPKSHERAVALAGELMDTVQDDPAHPVLPILEVLADAIEKYENATLKPMPSVSGVEMLRFLMDQHQLTQSDLADVFGSQGNVSQILKGKRALSLAHIKQLAQRFGVSAAIFMEPS